MQLWLHGPPDRRAQQKALQPLIAEARKRHLAVIGRVRGKAPEAAASASAAGLDALITGEQAPASGRLKIILAARASQASAHDSAIIALADAKWPRIPTQWRNPAAGNRRDRADAGPTGAPWVDANGWMCALASAKAPGKSLWTLAEPPEDVAGYRPANYALAVADSAAYGASWVVAFDAETRKALASDAANPSWKAVCDAIRFFSAREKWRQQTVVAHLGIISDFSGPSEALAAELLNLTTRRHLPFRIIEPSTVNPAVLKGLKVALWIGSKAPEGPAQAALPGFAHAGGLLILPASAAQLVSGQASSSFEGRYDYYSIGQGKIALASKPWSDPWLLAADTHLLLGRKYDVIRTFNAGSCNVRYTAGQGRGIAQVISYTTRPASHPASLYVAHPYKTARWSTLSGVTNEPLEVRPKGEGVEVYLPEFAPYAAIEFEG